MHIILRIVVKVKNFKVSGERLLEFLGAFISDERPGRIIEIDKYYPQELA